jgi:hypothetical protein
VPYHCECKSVAKHYAIFERDAVSKYCTVCECQSICELNVVCECKSFCEHDECYAISASQSVSAMPSLSNMPSIRAMPSISIMPSVSTMPSASIVPSVSGKSVYECHAFCERDAVCECASICKGHAVNEYHAICERHAVCECKSFGANPSVSADKWQEQEKIGTDKKTSTIEIKINPLPPTISLGRFKRVTLIKKESDCVLDSVNDGYQLRCSCEKFRKHGSCDETKFFGVIFFNRWAPSKCKPPLFKGMKKEKMSMIEQIQKTTSSFDSVKATSSPSIDPWRLK